jgi:hypothetical protein
VGQASRGRATAPPPTPGPADATHRRAVTTNTPPVTDDGLAGSRPDCGRLELVNVRPFNLVPRRRGNAPGPAPGGYVLMQRESQGSAEPLSTHSSIQILANEHSCPTSGRTGRSAPMPASSAACCSSPSRRSTEPDTSTTPPPSPSRERRPRLIVCCSPCVPPTRRRSSRCWASSHRRPHRALRTPGRVSNTRGGNYARLGGALLPWCHRPPVKFPCRPRHSSRGARLHELPGDRGREESVAAGTCPSSRR